MGLPVTSGVVDLEKVLLDLSLADRVEVIKWLSDSLVDALKLPTESPHQEDNLDDYNTEEVLRLAEEKSVDTSDKPTWYGDFDPFAERSTEERLAALHQAAGAWSDWAPDDLAEQILAERTIDES